MRSIRDEGTIMGKTEDGDRAAFREWLEADGASPDLRDRLEQAYLAGVHRGRPDVGRYRHLGRNRTYRLTSREGMVQTSLPIVEGDVLATYVDEDGRVWHRPVGEFDDGRFEKLDVAS